VLIYVLWRAVLCAVLLWHCRYEVNRLELMLSMGSFAAALGAMIAGGWDLTQIERQGEGGEEGSCAAALGCGLRRTDRQRGTSRQAGRQGRRVDEQAQHTATVSNLCASHHLTWLLLSSDIAAVVSLLLLLLSPCLSRHFWHEHAQHL
jgi:hypothetical protein